MATLVNTGTQAQTTAANSITTNSPSASAGNKLVLCISWVLGNDPGVAQTLTAPSGWTGDHNVASAENVGSGVAGFAVFSKTAAGGVESPVINTPSGASNFYADAIITEWSGMGAHDTNDASALITNNTGGASTGTTVPNTGTLAAANNTVFSGLAMLSGTGLANANFAFSGGGWTTELNDGNTNSSVGAIIGHKTVSSNTALGAVFTWTNDASILAFQAAVVVFNDSATTSTTWNKLGRLLPGQKPGNNPPLNFFRQGIPAGVSVTVALTGQTATFSAGTLTPSTATALTGQTATFTGGTLSPSTSIGLTGRTATFAGGTLTPSLSIPLIGASSAFTSGAVTPNTSVPLVGQIATFTAGTFTPQVAGDVTVALTGQTATFAAGQLIATGSDVASAGSNAGSPAGGRGDSWSPKFEFTKKPSKTKRSKKAIEPEIVQLIIKTIEQDPALAKALANDLSLKLDESDDEELLALLIADEEHVISMLITSIAQGL